ncbi:MAG TPA: tRNA (guanosine(46)-N7)-methyltransferase TrmB [Ktedonobacteraceae bacterium]|nr:tRNA (guanosine(46)-N7)-methyltransferase TrmB [Ktedonobacteraceae bacterium]
MPRRTFLRYTKAQKLDEQTLQKYLLCFKPETLHHSWQTLPRLRDLFGNEAPLELEVGCGSAEFLCSLALKHPETNFVGVDISGRSLFKAAENASELQVTNIKFINADFHLIYPLLCADSLQSVYLHFPDPHLKPRCRKRRIFNQGFLDQMAMSLVVDGRLSVMTDIEELFMEMLQLIEQDTRFEKVHQERYLVGFEPAIKSHFQRIWEHYGERVFRFEVRRI